MTVSDLLQGKDLGPEFVKDGTAKKVFANIDGTTIVKSGAGVLSSPAETAGATPFTPTAPLTSTNVQAAIEELALAVSGVAHTSITGIDLKATANPNEYTVEITWTDADGNNQTNTDPTPITISQQDLLSAAANNVLDENADGLHLAVFDLWGDPITT